MLGKFLSLFCKNRTHPKHSKQQVSPEESKGENEFAQKSGLFMAAKIYNELPIETSKEATFSLFSNKLNNLFAI